MSKELRKLVKFMIYKSISENFYIDPVKEKNKNKKNLNLKK